MNRRHDKLEHNLTGQEEQQAIDHREQSTRRQEALEFSTPEELLRHDAAETQVPKGLRERLHESAPSRSRAASFWRRVFGRNS